MAVLTALHEQSVAGKVAYIAIDVTDRLLEGVRDGMVAGLIAQAPHAIGYQAVRMVAAIDKKLPAQRKVILDSAYLT